MALLERGTAAFGFPTLGRGVTLVVGLLVIAGMVWHLAGFVRDLSRAPGARGVRLTWRAGLWGAVTLTLLLTPFPAHVIVPAVLAPQDPNNLFVSLAGTLVATVPSGTRVVAGQTVARLENFEAQRQVLSLEGQRNRQRVHVANLQRQRARDPQAGNELVTAQEVLADLEHRSRDRRRDLAQLILVAPVDGVVLPPPERGPSTDPDEAQAEWCGTPLEDQNLTCHLDTGTLFCRIADPARLQAVLTVAESELDRLAIGQAVSIRRGRWHGTVADGRIVEIAQSEAERRPPAPHAGEARSWPSPAETPQPAGGVRYRVRVELTERSAELLTGSRYVARVRVASLSVLQRAIRYLHQTFALGR